MPPLRLIFLIVLLTFFAGAGGNAVTTSANPYLHKPAEDGTLRFELTERIQHPHFWWPRTLLNYHVVLDGDSAPTDTWTLTEETSRKQVPLQISDLRKENGRLVSATVSFFSDLPTGGHYSFLLKTRNPGKGDQAATGSDLVSTADGQTVLDTGSLKVRLPSSQSVDDGTKAPGPITAVNDGKGWVGESYVDSPVKRVMKVTTELLDKGPLFARARVTYDFEGGARYKATVKAPIGYKFVEFSEEFSGLTVADKAVFHFLWKGLLLTHRNRLELIDKPRILPYRGEDPHFTGTQQIENPREEFYYRLVHSAADGTISRTSANFSNPSIARSVGLCVLDGSKWKDSDYSIWSSSDTLSVKFRYRNDTLEWLLPIVGASRHLGITAYDPGDPKDTEIRSRFALSSEASTKASIANRGMGKEVNLTAFINSRYGGMSLDVVKDWVLAYPESGRRSHVTDLSASVDTRSAKNLVSIEAYSNALWGENELMHAEGNWFSPVTLRALHGWIVPGFNKFRDQMTSELRARVTALLLFQSYLAGREEISPMRHMLKGHPNFMADWKYPLMMSPYFFPDHPLAAEWTNQWEKFVELAGIFYVRPEVQAWDAKGGRWTESIGVYNWAFIEPVTLANDLGLLYDGVNRIPSSGQDLHGSYLAGTVTAPVKLGENGAPFDFTPGTPLLPQNGFQRIHPPMGAHSSRRKIPGCIEKFAAAFRNYDPLLAEHLLWINRRPVGSRLGSELDQGKADAHFLSQGTDPHLRSKKFTGYGVILRSAIDTTNEISVYLQQIDKGPNYRWGFGNENGGGDIYYYAGGNSYTGHFGEDAGDRRSTDAELTANTGVYKDSTFRGIGMNDLTEPLYDLGVSQFAEILSRPGSDAYSWPEYESRSVMLVGHDYIVIFDTLNSMSRVSWNTVKGQDKMPTIISIKGENAFRTLQTSEGGHGQITEGLRLEPYKSGGDRITLVSHRQDIKVVHTKHSQEGESAPTSVHIVTPEGNDFVFENRLPFSLEESGKIFSGRAGVIREFKDGRKELTLFKGEKIGNQDIVLEVGNLALGVSGAYKTTSDVSGQYYSYAGGKLSITLPNGLPSVAALYVNGAPVKAAPSGNTITADLLAGGGSWQLTTGAAVPMAPEISSSLAQNDGASIQWSPVASATEYRIELSKDGGLTWTPAGTAKEGKFTLSGIKAPEKVHLRVIALNGTTESLPGKDFPVYVTGKPPEPPFGLRLKLGKDEVSANWGQILGAKEYVLYRRKAGTSAWKEIHRGPESSFRDQPAGVVPFQPDPGLEARAWRQPAESPAIYEYAVSAVDAVGEGSKSSVASTDPSSWRNWYPNVPLHYIRRSAYWLPPYVKPEQVPPAEYPR